MLIVLLAMAYPLFLLFGKTISHCLTAIQFIPLRQLILSCPHFIFSIAYTHSRLHTHTRLRSFFKFIRKNLLRFVYQALVACCVNRFWSDLVEPLPKFCLIRTCLVWSCSFCARFWRLLVVIFRLHSKLLDLLLSVADLELFDFRVL